MHTRSFFSLAVPLASLCLVLPAACETSLSSSKPAATSSAEPAMQLPPDRKAYKAAHDIADPDQICLPPHTETITLPLRGVLR